MTPASPSQADRLRILVVAQHYWPSLGGAEMMLRRLSAEWARLGCEVVVLTGRCNRGWPAEETQEGVRIVRHPVLGIRWLGTIHYVRTLSRWIDSNRGGIDVAYVSMFKHAAWSVVRAGERIGLPVVLRAEGAGVTGDMAWQQGALFGADIRRTCQRAAAFVAPSPIIQQEMLAAGYDASLVHLVPNGVPIPEEPWRRDQLVEFRLKCGLPERRTIVFTGRLHAGKGLKDLIEAVAELAPSLDVQVAIVGEGPERSALTSLADRLGVSDRVILAGQVESVESWLRAGDLYVLPSYDEGLSVALLEALALGMPCLASDIPANRGILPAEMLPHFPTRDSAALAALIRATVRKSDDSLVEQRWQIAERFGINSVAQRHLDLFRPLRPYGPQSG